MTTLNTTDDLLRAARANREFREAFRREILTDDLVNLPQRFESHASETTKNINALTSNIAELTKSIAQMNSNVDGMEERLAQQIDGVGAKVDTELRAQSAFRGTYAQSAANKERINIANEFAYLHGVKYTYAMGIRRDA